MDAKTIKAAVKEFFNGQKYVYATPDTANHSANFYGDNRVCKLCQRDVISCVEMMESMMTDESESAMDVVFDDLQLDRPSNE